MITLEEGTLVPTKPGSVIQDARGATFMLLNDGTWVSQAGNRYPIQLLPTDWFILHDTEEP